MTEHPEVKALVEAVKQRCNALYAGKVAVVGLALAGSLAVVGSLFWVNRGEAVPGGFIGVVVLAALALGAAFFVHGRIDDDVAASFADEHFGLKDGLTSAIFLERKNEDRTADLQWKWLGQRVDACSADSIERAFPTRTAVFAGLMLMAALWLALLPPSDEVLAREQAERETREQVAESKKALEDLIEELDGEIVAPGERQVLALDEFRKLVKQIDETGDRTEAARQFARIEQKMRDAARALDQRRDMETLQLAASELGKAEETEPRQLGKKLSAKDLEAAREMMKKLAQKKFDAKEMKKGELGNKKLAQAKKQLARLRAVSKRMAAAGKQRKGASQAGAGRANGAAGQGMAGAGAGMLGGQAGEQMQLEELMAELDDAAKELQELLEEIELDPDAEFEDGDFDGPMARVNGALGKFGGKLRRMHAKQKALSKLDQLRMGLAQAQGMFQGEQMMLGLAQGQGGLQPGRGSSWSERKERDDSQKNGGLAQLKGQHGQGPSLSAVEEAESGSGVSGRRGTAKQRKFAREIESFVQRDDVPEALKLGVRNYFENLQGAAPRPEEE